MTKIYIDARRPDKVSIRRQVMTKDGLKVAQATVDQADNGWNQLELASRLVDNLSQAVEKAHQGGAGLVKEDK